MSHFTVLVITHEDPTDEVLSKVLLPFHEYECTGIEEYVVDVDVTDEVKADFEKYKDADSVFGPEWVKSWNGAEERDGRYYRRTNPNAQWDWYVRGGRWQGMLLAKPGAVIRIGEPGVFCNDTMRPNGVDTCRLDQLDLHGMWADAEAKAAKAYDAVHKVLDGRTFTPWDDVLKAEGGDADKARAVYWAQQPIIDLKEAKLLGFFDDPAEYMISRDDYLAKARRGALVTFAVLKDGQWFQRGKMGWWGMVNDEKNPDEWNEQFAKLLEGLPPESTWLTVVDCHI